MEVEKTKLEYNFIFWIHLCITILAWVGPFLFNWKLMCSAFAIVILQHTILKKCILNEQHGVLENEDHTIYSAIFEEMGLRLNRKKLKYFIRNFLYSLLAVATFILQYFFHLEPLLF